MFVPQKVFCNTITDIDFRQNFRRLKENLKQISVEGKKLLLPSIKVGQVEKTSN